jgi:hypothetical protein
MKTIAKTKLYFLALIMVLIAYPAKAQTDLTSPDYLSAFINGNDVTLSWGESGSQGEWLNYDGGQISEALGLSEPGTFKIATLWPAGTLDSLAGDILTSMSFITGSNFGVYTIKIWTGEAAETLLYSQPVQDFETNTWNEVLLDTPVLLEAGTTYWLGLEVQQLESVEGVVAIDQGPAVAGLGDMINTGGDWLSLSDLTSLNANWRLRYFASSENIPDAVSPAGSPAGILLATGADIFSAPMNSPETGNTSLMLTAGYVGVNIYRDGVLLNADPLNDAYFTDVDLENGVYLYEVTKVYDEGESQPVERTVQVGAPKLTVDPAVIELTLQGGQIWNVDIILTNTGAQELTWEAGNLLNWMSVSQASGNIEVGQSETIQLTINTPGMGPGLNSGLIQLSSNNLNNVTTMIPVLVTIDGTVPAIFDLQVADFGQVPVLQSKLLTVNITNLTDALLMFLSFEAGSANYTAYPSTWALQPGESMPIIISFTPPDIGAFPDTLLVEHFGYQGSGVLMLPLTGEGMLLPPAGLTASIDETDLTLQWLPPGASSDVLRFGSGDPYSAIGTSSGTYEFAARFAPADLMPYTGKQLDEVGFFIYSTSADFNLKVYTGADADTEVINLPVSGLQADEWNDIELPFSILLDEVDYLWIGYEINQTSFDDIAGVDGGPGVNGSGDMLRINGNMWMTLGDYGYSKNWNIRGTLSDVADTTATAVNMTTGILNAPELNGYNVYRDDVKLNEEPIQELTYADVIVPGETYVYAVTAVYDAGESIPASVIVTSPTMLTMPEGWQFNTTSIAHNIHVPVEVLQIGFDLMPGDLIGAFYVDDGAEKSAGVAQWNDGHLVLTAYGDDPSTPQKDGFDPEEIIKWKIFFSNTQTIYPLEVEYSAQMPHHNGTFQMMGLSMIERMELGTVSVEEAEAFTQKSSLFPNPSTGNVTLSGLNGGEQITVFDTGGRSVLNIEAGSQMLHFSLERHGLYIVEIKGEREVIRKKLIIR